MFSAQSKFSETPRLAGDARAHYCSGAGQWRAMHHGIAGIDGNGGILESVSCRIHWRRESSNPTLSANLSFCVFNRLTGDVSCQRAMKYSRRLMFGL